MTRTAPGSSALPSGLVAGTAELAGFGGRSAAGMLPMSTCPVFSAVYRVASLVKGTNLIADRLGLGLPE